MRASSALLNLADYRRRDLLLCPGVAALVWPVEEVTPVGDQRSDGGRRFLQRIFFLFPFVSGQLAAASRFCQLILAGQSCNPGAPCMCYVTPPVAGDRPARNGPSSRPACFTQRETAALTCRVVSPQPLPYDENIAAEWIGAAVLERRRTKTRQLLSSASTSQLQSMRPGK